MDKTLGAFIFQKEMTWWDL